MGNERSKVEFDVEAHWKSEAKLSLEQRRKRYRCKKYITKESLPSWDKDVEESIKVTIERAKQEARQEEKNKRKQSYKEANKQDVKLSKEEQVRKERKQERKAKALEEAKAEKSQEYKTVGTYSHNAEINKKVCLIRSDITSLEIDAIVNAANRSLLGGGGIDGAIHRAAGDNLYKECSTLNGCETGQTKITRGYDLPSSYVLHTVGPIGKNEKALISSYATCLQLVTKHNIKTVALCGISTGIYGYPLYDASHVALNTVRTWLNDKANLDSVDLIIFCTFLEKELVCYQKLMPLYFPPEGKTTDDLIKIFQDAFTSYDPAADSDAIDKEVKEEFEEKLAKKNRTKQFEKKEEPKESKEETKVEAKETTTSTEEKSTEAASTEETKKEEVETKQEEKKEEKAEEEKEEEKKEEAKEEETKEVKEEETKEEVKEEEKEVKSEEENKSDE